MIGMPPAHSVLRRRAIVSGRAIGAEGTPFDDGTSLSLRFMPGDDAGISPKRRRQGKNSTEQPALRADKHVRRFACHMRRDGWFFFLDVPPGKYTLDRHGPDGEVAQSRDVLVPPYKPDAKSPIVTVAFELVGPLSRRSQPPGPGMQGPAVLDPNQLKGN